jgi:hypothetical protein
VLVLRGIRIILPNRRDGRGNEPDKSEDNVDDEMKIISPVVLADPLAPGSFTPAAVAFLPGRWREGEVKLRSPLVTFDDSLLARESAVKMCISLEEEG